MANSPKYAGREAREKLGWWRANRFLFWRRFTQLSILAMFLSGLGSAYGFCVEITAAASFWISFQ